MTLHFVGTLSDRLLRVVLAASILMIRNRMVRWRVKLRSKEQLYDRPKAISMEPGPTSTALNNSWTMCVAYELHRK